MEVGCSSHVSNDRNRAITKLPLIKTLKAGQTILKTSVLLFIFHQLSIKGYCLFERGVI